jgi:hypothetical protein
MKNGEYTVDSIAGTVLRAAAMPGNKFGQLSGSFSQYALILCVIVEFDLSH